MSTLPTLSARHEDPHSYPPGVAFMDGQYLPVQQARISVLDYGFLHSDATYDVVHVWQGAFFRLDAHLDRFFAGIRRLHMQIPFGREQVVDILHNCVALSGLRNAYVEMICTRGTAPTLSRDPRDAINRFIAFAIPFGSVASPEQLQNGLHVAVSEVVRIPPASLDPTIKNYHWLDFITALYEAYDRGADTVMLKDDNGNLTEGPDSTSSWRRMARLQLRTGACSWASRGRPPSTFAHAWAFPARRARSRRTISKRQTRFSLPQPPAA